MPILCLLPDLSLKLDTKVLAHHIDTYDGDINGWGATRPNCGREAQREDNDGPGPKKILKKIKERS